MEQAILHISYLFDIEFDIFRIHNSLIRLIVSYAATAALVKGLILICSDLNNSLIADGVVSKEHLEQLMSIDMSLAQGAFFAPTKSRTESMRWLDASGTIQLN